MRKLVTAASLPLLIVAVRFLPLDRLPAACVFYRCTGHPCPTCGMTRALIALTHLDLGRATAFHPVTVVFAAVVTLIWGLAVYEVLTGRRNPVLDWARRRALSLTLSALGLLLIFGALRAVGLSARVVE